MDSNVPKYTNSHKFFPAPFVWESSMISVEKLVKQLLLSTLDSCHQRLDICFDRQFMAAILDKKIQILTPKYKQLGLAARRERYLFTVNSMPLGYGCPLGLFLAAYWQISLQETIDNLSQCLVLSASPTATSFQLAGEIDASGWLKFYLDSPTVADWLKQLRLWMAGNFSAATFTEYPLCPTPKNLFPVQYIHARCCSLLRSAERENLITLKQDRHPTRCQIAEPKAISWLNRENCLWLNESAEYELLRQLLMVADTWQKESEIDWLKTALRLSRATAIFQANCRFLGRVRVLEPQKAIARLGLLDLVRSWLYLILQKKLKAAAPTEL